MHAIEQAYEDNAVLMAILRKIVPDLKAFEASGPDGGAMKLQISASDYDLMQRIEVNIAGGAQ